MQRPALFHQCSLFFTAVKNMNNIFHYSHNVNTKHAKYRISSHLIIRRLKYPTKYRQKSQEEKKHLLRDMDHYNPKRDVVFYTSDDGEAFYGKSKAPA